MIFKNYKVLVKINEAWFVILADSVKYIFYKNMNFYLNVDRFCCRHNIIHETEWPHYLKCNFQLICLHENIRVIPSFHYGISDCRKSGSRFPNDLKILMIGGYEPGIALQSFQPRQYTFFYGYAEFVFFCATIWVQMGHKSIMR